MDLLRQSWAAVRVLLVFTVILGVLYPAAGLAVAHVMPDRSQGSPVTVDGQVVGSSLIGQAFDGNQWFRPRPSAAGDGYDAMASSGSNLGPNNSDLVTQVQQRRSEVARREGVPESAVPADAVTASGSGLDPHISPEYARLQIARVAMVRGLSPEQVEQLVDEATHPAGLGVLGEPAVNVLELNAALQRAQ